MPTIKNTKGVVDAWYVNNTDAEIHVAFVTFKPRAERFVPAQVRLRGGEAFDRLLADGRLALRDAGAVKPEPVAETVEAEAPEAEAEAVAVEAETPVADEPEPTAEVDVVVDTAEDAEPAETAEGGKKKRRARRGDG